MSLPRRVYSPESGGKLWCRIHALPHWNTRPVGPNACHIPWVDLPDSTAIRAGGWLLPLIANHDCAVVSSGRGRSWLFFCLKSLPLNPADSTPQAHQPPLAVATLTGEVNDVDAPAQKC